MKYREVPIGHPVFIRGPSFIFDYSINKYFGLMRCLMLPPRKLFHPLLPTKIKVESGDEKLIFTLCKKCASDQTFILKCTHSDEERSFEGCWTTVEIYKAVELGCEIVEIYEVWDYRAKDGDLFASFVNRFLKVKQEKSGWHQGCESEEEKQNYIKRYEEKEGIKLDYDNIENNPVMRSSSKLLLNSCWGFWARRLDRRITTLTHDSGKFFDFVTDSSMRERVFRILNPFTVLCHGHKKPEAVIPNCKGNVVQAAYVTAYARLHLYEDLLERLGDRVLYMDTDSPFYISRKDREEFEPELGDYLGELTNVLEDVEGYDKSCVIPRFCSGGPKNYGYDVFSEEKNKKIKTCFKVTGIGLNRETERKVNFEKLFELVCKSQVLDLPKDKNGIVKESVEVPKFDIKRGDNDDPFFFNLAKF
ncbi:uncharacterized protein [Montipora capricornis]|uniref:uncharacterized protein n=1 Tax=Montipora capricornis TaxID=246305 RepID=UPI0035F1049A